ncbi:hypothetical protein [Paenibacillus sp. MBLB4367]
MRRWRDEGVGVGRDACMRKWRGEGMSVAGMLAYADDRAKEWA